MQKIYYAANFFHMLNESDVHFIEMIQLTLKTGLKIETFFKKKYKSKTHCLKVFFLYLFCFIYIILYLFS